MILPLEIHHINVSQGDSTLIIWRKLDVLAAMVEADLQAKGLGPIPEEDYLPYALKNALDISGTVEGSILIDGGEDCFGEDVYNYIKMNGIQSEEDRTNFYIVITHYHSDHVDGIRNIFWSAWDGADTYTERFPPGKIYDDWGEPSGAKPDTSTFNLYVKEVGKLVAEGKTEREEIGVGKEIPLGNYDNTQTLLRCVGSNGMTFDDCSKKSVQTIAPNIRSKKAIDPNALSTCLVLEYKAFRYFLGGDIGGMGNSSGGNEGKNAYSGELPSFSQHPDIETSLRRLLKEFYPKDRNSNKSCDGHMCGLKISHHGSVTSNDVYTLGMMQPKIAVISSGLKPRFFSHPSQEVLNRLDATVTPSWKDKNGTTGRSQSVSNSIENYYITEMAADSVVRKKPFQRKFPKGRIFGDIIIRPVTEDADNPKNGIQMHVFGSGIQSGIDAASNLKLRPLWKDTSQQWPSYYPTGAYIHCCEKHL